jgi:hypothetical protein
MGVGYARLSASTNLRTTAASSFRGERRPLSSAVGVSACASGLRPDDLPAPIALFIDVGVPKRKRATPETSRESDLRLVSNHRTLAVHAHFDR